MKRLLPWLFAMAISIIGVIKTVYVLQIAAGPASFAENILAFLSIAMISFLGALIVDRRMGNRLGWLMIAIGLATALPLGVEITGRLFPEPPVVLAPGIWLLLWMNNWQSWLLVILVFQIVLYFPDGQLRSAGWKWTRPVTLATIFVLALLPMFRETIGPINSAWSIDNPPGFISQSVFESASILWVLGLAALAAGSIISLYQRFRKGTIVEREQIKWLLYAGVLFSATIAISLGVYAVSDTSPVWLDLLYPTVMLIFPLAIANAILRYRLYDIEIIIRRTIQYALLSGLLALLYYGGVIVLQSMLNPGREAGSSPLVTVVTTLMIAALFNPLRTRVQEFIDRRFFRRKYDSEQALTEFADISRNEVDLGRLSESLLVLVENTMQPEQASLWLRESWKQKERI